MKLNVPFCPFDSVLSVHTVYASTVGPLQTHTLGTEKQFVVQRFTLFRSYFTHITIYLDPQKQSFVERFPLLNRGVCYKRLRCMHLCLDKNLLLCTQCCAYCTYAMIHCSPLETHYCMHACATVNVT